ncbi:protein SHH3 KNAG_0E02290 [Huiozyma naganishii CBS 8797]|uniref:Uncharacterized protein n=1 Tax=Huiozyma naganishii (strain ATCC MYA-139 / BCRC 22969 / CBS 8797 / KCTC 17520 / NBRC 10181 / NCYC 3082 / Yp74L-3) TaxID=1071383 RepID=J7R6M7_HUIN7|nr:hypothetical protein KNAG_0E02290 [Kazachstania naganishii CBS 8797]CCK70490.1 hypothetical protein KNAG_0E02290 [Kazachstania naganishii CBS 8797]
MSFPVPVSARNCTMLWRSRGRRMFSLRPLSMIGKKDTSILESQRAKRPISPHLTIYEPEISWYLSSLHRITGIFLGTGFFVLTISVGIGSLFGGEDCRSTAVVRITEWYRHNVNAKLDYGMRAVTAYFFAFHGWNGVRHLVWDMGKELSNCGVYRTGVGVLVLSVLTGAYSLSRT